MTRRTRVFMALAAGVLVLGVCVGLVAMYSGLPVLAQFGASRPELAYLPQDVRLVAYANVRQVMDSEIHRKLRDARPDGAGGSDRRGGPGGARENDLFRQAGIDVETDVDLVVVSLTGDANDETPLVLARGRFDDDLIETLIRQRGGGVEEYRGVRLLTHRDEGRAMGVSFVEPNLVAFGSEQAVRLAIDTKAGAVPDVAGNDTVMGMIRDVDDGNAWAVGRFDAISRRAPLPADVARQLPPLDWFSVSGHINGGLDGTLRLETRDAAAADDLRQVVQGFLALARLQTGRLEQFRALIESINLGGQGTTVTVTFSVPPTVIDALAALRNERRGVPPDTGADARPQTTPPAPARPPARPPRT